MIRSAIIKERSNTKRQRLEAAKAAYEKRLAESQEAKKAAMNESGGPVEKYAKEDYIEYGYDDNF